MPIYMAAADSLSSLSTPSIYAELRAGGDGDPYGAAEYDVGGAGCEMTEGRTTWDDDLSDGFDSGNVTVGLQARADGEATVAVADSTSGDVSASGGSIGNVGQVVVRLGVQGAQMQVRWNNLTVNFYRNGVLRESLSLAAPAQVTGTDQAPVREELLTFVPSDTDDDEVVVTGAVRLTSSEPDLQPDPNQIFSQILVYAG